jgi:GT2 family glycosyltransferase
MTVAVLIVNWNGGDLLSRCLESLAHQHRPPDRIVVVDNASTDDSLTRAGALLRDVQVIRLASNVGFARANNIAADAAGEVDALALLNPDAFAEPGWLDALVTAAEHRPSTAAFASRILLASSPQYLDGAGDSYHTSGRAWRNGHRVPSATWPAIDAEVFAPCAAAALYRRAAFHEVRGFDESFFCYFEDVDLGFRLRLRGYDCTYVHSAVVRHSSSASTGYRSDFAVYHGERNMVWTFVKDMPGSLFWLYLPQHIALNVAALLFYPWRRQGRAVFRAKFDALRGLPAVLKRRRAVQRDRLVGAWALRKAMAGGTTAPYVGRYRYAAASSGSPPRQRVTGA